MDIHLENISKRYKQDWVIKDFSFKFLSNHIYGIQGINGSGKSTLLKILSGSLSPSLGKIHYQDEQERFDINQIYKHVAYAAAEDELVEELTIEELLSHASKFAKLSISSAQFISEYAFDKHRNKLIGEYSSGMKQRLKLGLVISSKKQIKLFDEPTSYLDDNNKSLFYQQLQRSIEPNQLICIASNAVEDFAFCQQVVSL